MEIKLDNTMAVLQQFADEVVEAYKQGLTEYNAITQGHHFLYDSVSANVPEAKGGHITVSINLAEYWKYIETGRQAYGEDWRGHRPPISAIENWITWKPYNGSTTRGVSGYAALTPDLSHNASTSTSNLSLAYAVATNIAKKGIEAKPILRNSVEHSLIAFKSRLQEALAIDMGNNTTVLISEVFKAINPQGETITETIVL